MNTNEIKFGLVSKEDEDKHLSFVLSEINSYKNSLSKTKAKIQQLRAEMVYESREQKLETMGEIDNLKRKLENIKNLDQKLLDEPYFARMDLNGHEFCDDNICYISKYSIRDAIDNNREIKYINWRTPKARLYYKFNNSPAKNVSCGDWHGDIDLTARLKISKSKLQDIKVARFGTNLGDSTLQERLSGSSSDTMSDIVETIQGDQDDIIRYDKNNNIVIQGAAGSGKTAIALHRVAYLLYEKYKSHDMLFISPNSDFTKYISEVLPELGETNIPVKTFNDFFSEIFGISPNSIEGMIEWYLKSGEKSESLSRFYSSEADEWMESAFRAVDEKKSILENYIKAFNTLINDGFYDVEVRGSAKKGTSPFIKLNDADNAQLKKYLRISQHEINDLWKAATMKTHAATGLSHCAPDLDKGAYMPALFFAILKAKFDNVRYYNTTVENVGIESNGTSLATREVKHDIKYIVIDEAQDYTKWHIYLLKLLCPSAKFMILGDINQNISPYIKNKDLRNLLSAINLDEEPYYCKINKAYRSSPEIIIYTNKILGLNIKPIRASQGIEVLKRNISLPLLLCKKDLTEQVQNLKAKKYNNICIITRDNEMAELIRKMDISDISVLPVYKAKGLEYDAVIVIDNFNHESRFEKELFYVACTRAQHSLTVLKDSYPKLTSDIIRCIIRLKGDTFSISDIYACIGELELRNPHINNMEKQISKQLEFLEKHLLISRISDDSEFKILFG